MTEVNQGKDLSEMLSRIDREWRELRQVISRTASTPQDESAVAAAETSPAGESEIDLEPPERPGRSYSGPAPSSVGIIPGEMDAIFSRVEKINRDTEFSDRLMVVEKQVRKITILGACYMTLSTLAAAVLIFIMVQANLLTKSVLFQGREQAVQKAAVPQDPKPPQPATGESQVQPAPSQPQPAPAAAAPPQASEAPVKYVGSLTSNKYHYPHCKWVPSIRPERLINFKSVEEAAGKNYIPCPACKPPTSD